MVPSAAIASVRLIELVGMKVDVRLGLTRLEHEHIVLLEVGDEHPALAVEADAVADTAVGELGEELRLRGPGAQLADRPPRLEVHDVQGAGGVDGWTFDAVGILARRRRHAAALEQRHWRTL